MDETAVLRLIDSGEGQEVEFKSDLPSKIRSLAKGIAAFATSNHGFLIFGVGDDKAILGLELANSAGGRQNLVGRVEGICQSLIAPMVTFKVHFPTVQGKILMVVEVEKGNEPLYFADGRAYLRQHSMSRVAKPDEIRDLLFRDELIRRIEALEARPAAAQTTAPAITGQGELATMNVVELLDRMGIRSRQF
jgi:predicted HTH transcriptional regulator